jgi:hypothetical protein
VKCSSRINKIEVDTDYTSITNKVILCDQVNLLDIKRENVMRIIKIYSGTLFIIFSGSAAQGGLWLHRPRGL